MLELELQSLKTEIELLRKSINSLTATMVGAAHAALLTTPISFETPIETLPVEDQPVTESKIVIKDDSITVESLQDLCTSMVRSNPEIKTKIKALIASFDGAKVISKVSADRLPELKKALEALK